MPGLHPCHQEKEMARENSVLQMAHGLASRKAAESSALPIVCERSVLGRVHEETAHENSVLQISEAGGGMIGWWRRDAGRGGIAKTCWLEFCELIASDSDLAGSPQS